jgi:hypothetical protein
MAQPVAYNLSFSFTDWTANHPTVPQPGVSLDNEFRGVALTTNQISSNLAIIQRDDGALANGSVGPDQVAATLTLGLRSVSTWTTLHAYVVNDAVWTANKLYRCLAPHTASPAFSTDLAAARWELIFDLMPPVLAALQTGAISVNIDTSALQAEIDLCARLAAMNVFTAKQTVVAGNSTAYLGYFRGEPTDYGAGKPAFVVRKWTTPGQWNLALDDGVAGTGFVLNIDVPSGFLKVNGNTVWHAGNFDPATKTDVSITNAFAAKIAHARRLAIVL